VLAAGRIEAALSETRSARAQALACRRRILVGVNDYPDLTMPMTLDAAAPGDEDLSFDAERPAAPFERIRLRTLRHAHATGRTPRVLLLLRGDVA
jgi:methylmalonyl-CoA mutase N-terminal domain/subunit